MKIKCWWLTISLFLISSTASAHTGDHMNSHFLSGLLHPLSGLDHLLALIAIGMLAIKKSSKTLFVFPLSFIALMTCGMLINQYQIRVSYIETFIALSVIFLGFLISVKKEQLYGTFLIVISCFALFHGYAHANAMSQIAQPMYYLSGILLMSLIICIAGTIIGYRIDKMRSAHFSLAYLFSGLYFLTVA